MIAEVKLVLDKQKILSKEQKKRKLCRKKLISQIIKDTSPYVPMRDGTLFQSAITNQNRYENRVVWNGPYARFLHEGKVMVGIKTHRPWSKRGEIKTVAEKDLTYSKTHPLACAKWTVVSKGKNIKSWLNFAKKVFKNG